MASITLIDLPLSEVLDRQAMRSLRGAAGEGNWVLGAFPAYIAPIASSPSVVQVFNYMQQITNNYTYVGQMVNQTTTVDITNSGANSPTTRYCSLRSETTAQNKWRPATLPSLAAR